MAKATYYLEVISSWCYWAEPAWAELKRRYAGQAEFGWKIAQMPPEAYPQSKTQCDWFYRRSGAIMRSPFMLNSGWFEQELKEYLAPNYVAEAAKNFGVTDDRVRLAITQAALREGKKVGRWEVAVAVAAQAAGLDAAKLLLRAQSSEVAARTQATTAEFHALQVTQLNRWRRQWTACSQMRLLMHHGWPISARRHQPDLVRAWDLELWVSD